MNESPVTGAVSASPFADPDYGREAEAPGYIIASKPTWTLEQNQSAWTGLAGVVVLIAGGIFFSSYWHTPDILGERATAAQLDMFETIWKARYGLLMLFAFIAMFLLETLCFKTHRRHFDFSTPRPVDAAAWRRIFGRWIVVALGFALAWSLYWLWDHYAGAKFEVRKVFREGEDFNQYANGLFFVFFFALLPIALVCSVPYFWLVERYARPGGPHDEFLIAGLCLKRFAIGFFDPAYRAEGYKALSNEHLHNLGRGLLVKFFFVPIMLQSAFDYWGRWEDGWFQYFYEYTRPEHATLASLAFEARTLQHTLMNLLIALDTTLALLGYIVSVRLLDTQITTAEPTFLGWVAALLLYAPFNTNVTNKFFLHGGENDWSKVLENYPLLTISVALLSILLMAIYTWSTVSFGLRFSNLTNRGIICKGPYAVVRHPAYISKNLAWWFEGLPFVNHDPWMAVMHSVNMFSVNLLYVLRAWTEERHLSREPHYQAYKEKVRWKFIPFVW